MDRPGQWHAKRCRIIHRNGSRFALGLIIRAMASLSGLAHASVPGISRREHEEAGRDLKSAGIGPPPMPGIPGLRGARLIHLREASSQPCQWPAWARKETPGRPETPYYLGSRAASMAWSRAIASQAPVAHGVMGALTAKHDGRAHREPAQAAARPTGRARGKCSYR